MTPYQNGCSSFLTSRTRKNIISIEELQNLDAVRVNTEMRRVHFRYPALNFQNTNGSSVRAFAFR